MRRLLFFVVVLALVLTPSASAMHWLDDGDAQFSNVLDITVEAENGSGATVNYTPPTASDENGSVDVSCDPGPGGTFSIGTTPVDCSATGTNGVTVHAGFNVTVQDTTAPVVDAPDDVVVTTGNPAGQAVTYPPGSASDAVAGSIVPTCTPGSGSTFPVGPTTVTCTASDGTNTGTDTFTVTVNLVDTTGPTLSLPANITAEATSSAGAPVTYSASANDLVSGSVAVNCSPASGSTFPIATTTVNCSATDGASNTTNGSFAVTVGDHTAPVLSNFGNKTVEANGPTGSAVSFTTPTAVDSVDGPVTPVGCNPGPGATFPLGITVVNCSATDAHGNIGTATFNVTVVDTTPPVLAVPASFAIHATSADGIPRTNGTISSYLASAVATDIVDGNPVIVNDAPAVVPIGATDVTWTARDASGNSTSRIATIVVLPRPPAGTPPLPVPTPPVIPAEVKNVTVTPLDGAVRIQWDADGRRVEVIRSTSSSRTLSALVDEKIVYSGTASSYVDRGLENGVEYRYVVRAVDGAGNHSAGVAAVVAPRVDMLKSPKNGARLKKAPKLLWRVDSEAAYYNAQLLFNGAKVLSVWPTRASFALKKSWKYNGRKYTLKPGLYTWFVWPGYGVRASVDYGPLMGSRTFRIVR